MVLLWFSWREGERGAPLWIDYFGRSLWRPSSPSSGVTPFPSLALGYLGDVVESLLKLSHYARASGLCPFSISVGTLVQDSVEHSELAPFQLTPCRSPCDIDTSLWNIVPIPFSQSFSAFPLPVPAQILSLFRLWKTPGSMFLFLL